jgi:histidine triad (HIT) family protein
MEKLPVPPPEAIFLDNDKLYACLASFPITLGHTVVVWKKDVKDLHLLGRQDYELLMDTVDSVRSAMLNTLDIDKVYLMYMDEIDHVHWHLIPRYDEEGYNILEHKPDVLTDFSLAPKISANLIKVS